MNESIKELFIHSFIYSFIHLFVNLTRSMSCYRPIAYSEASYPKREIKCFHLQVPESSSFLTVIQ